jgi:hypothetical protein
MSARTRVIATALFLAAPLVSTPAFAQVSAAPLDKVDPWGVGYLGKADGALPTTLWANTDADALTPIFATLEPLKLSPAARAALRRVILSSVKPPAGGGALIPERLRIIEQLGETERSIDLRKRFPDTSWGMTGDRLASDYELANGRSQTACARVADKRADDPLWMPVRALCYALAGDFNAASMIGEQTLSADGQSDVWLLAALETMRAPTRTPPAGRYTTPFEVAVSVAAKLSVPTNSMRDLAPDIAAAIVRHASATPEQKRAALPIAVDGGKLLPSEVVAVLTAKDEAASPDATGKAAAGKSQRVAAPKTDFLALALAAAAKDDMAADAKATSFAVALKGADTPSDFRLAASALNAAVKALPRNDDTLPNAETFARAALIMGDEKQAADWRKLMDKAPDDTADAWAKARIDLMLSWAGSSGDKGAVILNHLLDAVPPPQDAKADAKTKATTPAQRELELRRIENTRILFLYVGTGRQLPPAARALLASLRTAGRGVSDAALARILSANDADAHGEAALAAIAEIGPDASAISFAGLCDLLIQLRAAGLSSDADALALEALQVWKAL